MELKVYHSPGKIFRKPGNSRHILDQLDPDEIWVDAAFIKSYVKNKYGITKEQYYNLVVYNDINHEHKCAWCGKQTELYRLAGYHTYCSISCKTSMINHNGWKKDDYRNKHTNIFYENARSDVYSYKRIALQELSRFRNIVKDNRICTFYLGVTDKGELKFGITSDISKNYNYRLKQSKWKWENLKSIHAVFKGNKYQVSWIECEIKLRRKDASEHLPFDKITEIKQLLRELIPIANHYEDPASSTTIEKQLTAELSRVESSDSK